jgi:hypothetical protein
MLRNGIPRVCFYFFPRNGIPSIFLLCGAVRNGTSRVFCSVEWFRTKFREFSSICVPWYRIPSILLLCGTVRNGIPRVLCSAERPEFRRNKPIVPSIPSSAEYFFFVGNCQPLQVLYRKRRQKDFRSFSCTFIGLSSVYIPSEAEFMDVIGTKVFRVFLLATHSHLY